MNDLEKRNQSEKCAGQESDGTRQCAYRNACARYVRPSGDSQRWADYWKAGDDCPQYISLVGAI